MKQVILTLLIAFVALTQEVQGTTNERGSDHKELWKKSIAGIKGYHLMLPNDYWGKLPCIIEFSGIPQYALYDRQGKRIYHLVGFADGTEQHFKEVILKALGE